MLKDFIADLAIASINDDTAFKSLINRGLELGVSDADFAETVGVSVPTVRRWRKGLTVPHPMLRIAIFGVLQRILENKNV